MREYRHEVKKNYRMWKSGKRWLYGTTAVVSLLFVPELAKAANPSLTAHADELTENTTSDKTVSSTSASKASSSSISAASAKSTSSSVNSSAASSQINSSLASSSTGSSSSATTSSAVSSSNTTPSVANTPAKSSTPHSAAQATADSSFASAVSKVVSSAESEVANDKAAAVSDSSLASSASSTAASALADEQTNPSNVLSDASIAAIENNLASYENEQASVAALAAAEVVIDPDVNNLTDLETALSKAPTDGKNYDINISGNISLTNNAYLWIPSGANVTLESTDGTGIISRDASSTSYSLIYVNPQATLTIDNGLTINGNNIGTQANAGAIDLDAGTLNINGGTIENNAGNFGGAVIAYEGSTINMTGGTLSGNTASYGGAIYAYDNSTVNLSGGSITDNTGHYYGGGLYLKGASATINGGAINGNTANYDGGGVYVDNGATLTLDTGGTINSNTAEFFNADGSVNPNYGTAGGGVYINAGGTFTQNGGSVDDNTALEGGGLIIYGTYSLLGGEVNGNNAAYYGTGSVNGQGGGMVIHSSDVKLIAGQISNNTSGLIGGGITLFDDNTLDLEDVLVDSNTSNGNDSQNFSGKIIPDSDNGGAFWVCPVGSIYSYITNGGAYYDNTAATGTLANLQSTYGSTTNAAAPSQSSTIYIESGTLGGGTETVTQDGVTLSLPTTVTGQDLTDTNLDNDMSQSSIALAANVAKLIISGNTSGSGAGISTNGNLIIGSPDTTNITISKDWDLPNGEAEPASVTFNLIGTLPKGTGNTTDTVVLGQVTLSAANKWTYTVTGLPSDLYTYSFQEVNSGKTYDVIVTKDSSTSSTTSSTYQPTWQQVNGVNGVGASYSQTSLSVPAPSDGTTSFELIGLDANGNLQKDFGEVNLTSDGKGNLVYTWSTLNDSNGSDQATQVNAYLINNPTSKLALTTVGAQFGQISSDNNQKTYLQSRTISIADTAGAPTNYELIATNSSGNKIGLGAVTLSPDGNGNLSYTWTSDQEDSNSSDYSYQAIQVLQQYTTDKLSLQAAGTGVNRVSDSSLGSSSSVTERIITLKGGGNTPETYELVATTDGTATDYGPITMTPDGQGNLTFVLNANEDNLKYYNLINGQDNNATLSLVTDNTPVGKVNGSRGSSPIEGGYTNTLTISDATAQSQTQFDLVVTDTNGNPINVTDTNGNPIDLTSPITMTPDGNGNLTYTFDTKVEIGEATTLSFVPQNPQTLEDTGVQTYITETITAPVQADGNTKFELMGYNNGTNATLHDLGSVTMTVDPSNPDQLTYTWSSQNTDQQSKDATSGDYTNLQIWYPAYSSIPVSDSGIVQTQTSQSITVNLPTANNQTTFELYGNDNDNNGNLVDLGPVTMEQNPSNTTQLIYTWSNTDTSQQAKQVLSGQYSNLQLYYINSYVPDVTTDLSANARYTTMTINGANATTPTTYELYGENNTTNKLDDLGKVTLQPDASGNLVYTWYSTNTDDAQTQDVFSSNYPNLTLWYEVKGETINDTTTDITYDVTNKDDLQEIKITKKWDLPTGEAEPASADFTLYGIKDGKQVWSKAVTLTATENWTTTITGLPMNLYDSYTLVENSTGKTYDVTVSSAVDATNPDEIDFTVTNKDDLQEIKITKNWSLPTGETIPDSAKFTLYGVDANGNETAIQDITLTASENWTTTITGLPSNLYSKYTLQEDSTGKTYDVNVTETPDATNANEIDFAVTNKDDLQEIKITKNWSLPTGENIPSSADFTLYGVAADGTQTAIQDVTLTAAENWTTTITGLPMNLYDHYTLQENSTGKTYDVNVTETPDATNANEIDFMVTNKDDLQEIEITKKWDLPTDETIPSSADFTLYGVAANGTQTAIQDVTLTAAGNWTTTITGLPMDLYDHYALQENSTGKTYDVTVSSAADATNPDEVDFTVTNKDDLQQIEITKNWKLPAGDKTPTSVEFTLYGVAANGTETKVQDVTLTSAENWTTIISDLPMYLYDHYTLVEDQTGTVYQVSVTEETDSADANQIDFDATNSLTPTTPPTPGHPGTPGTPGTPGIPGTPGTPGKPNIPQVPNTPSPKVRQVNKKQLLTYRNANTLPETGDEAVNADFMYAGFAFLASIALLGAAGSKRRKFYKESVQAAEGAKRTIK